jgi:hypothetical protein
MLVTGADISCSLQMDHKCEGGRERTYSEGTDATPTTPTTPDISDEKPEQEAPQADDDETDQATRDEVKASMKWASKGRRARLFEPKALDPIVADALNKCAVEGDLRYS